MNRLIVAAIRCSLMFLVPSVTYAISTQWDLDPISGDWNTAANWTPMDVPNGPADIATFGLSHTTDVSISANTEVNSIIFTSAATSAYSITANAGLTLTISGAGITNNSGITQNFVTAGGPHTNDLGTIQFTNSATAGSLTAFTNNGLVEFSNNATAGSATITNNGFGNTIFRGNSTAGNGLIINNGFEGYGTGIVGNASAGNGTFINNGGTISGSEGGITLLDFTGIAAAANATFISNGGAVSGARGGITECAFSNASGGTFINNGATVSGAAGGTTSFGLSSAGNATITNNAGAVSGAGGGTTSFFSSSADTAMIINNGATVSGAEGGITRFSDSTAESATLIANGGTGGGEGGTILFLFRSTGGTCRVEVFGNGNLDVSGATSPPRTTVGSIEGDGNVFLGANNLKVGSNNLSTTFSGVIQDGGQNGGVGGSLTKIGSGTLDLTGTNTYTGDTNVNGGVLQVDGSITSNTFVHPSGKLTGTGMISGELNNKNGGNVSPGETLGGPGVLTVVHNYAQAQYAKLMIQIAGTSPGQFSVLDVLGNASLNAILDPVLLNGFVPTIGDSFTFLNYASSTGEFSHIQNQVFNHGTEQWSITYLNTNAILTVEPHTPIPDGGSTFLLLTLGLLGLVTFRRQLSAAQNLSHR